MLVEPELSPLTQAHTRHFLRLLPGAALNEAEVLRLLARSGVAVQRRAWGPAEAGAPTLLLVTAPAPDAVAARAAALLQERTGAQVRRLPAEQCGAAQAL